MGGGCLAVFAFFVPVRTVSAFRMIDNKRMNDDWVSDCERMLWVLQIECLLGGLCFMWQRSKWINKKFRNIVVTYAVVGWMVIIVYHFDYNLEVIKLQLKTQTLSNWSKRISLLPSRDSDAALPVKEEEYREVFEEKNSAWAVISLHGTQQIVERFKQKRTRPKNLPEEKKNPPVRWELKVLCESWNLY